MEIGNRKSGEVLTRTENGEIINIPGDYIIEEIIARFPKKPNGSVTVEIDSEGNVIRTVTSNSISKIIEESKKLDKNSEKGVTEEGKTQLSEDTESLRERFVKLFWETINCIISRKPLGSENLPEIRFPKKELPKDDSGLIEISEFVARLFESEKSPKKK